METMTKLDSDELLHLALKATQENKTEDSINLLKRAISVDPESGRAYYLLGALHAEIGLYDRAIDEMNKAIELEPGIDAAHFQLGLLYLTSGNVSSAQSTWKKLDELGDQHPFWLFKEGMLNLAQDNFNQCIELLEKGVEVNTINEALNNDMLRVIEKAREAQNSISNDAKDSVDTKDANMEKESTSKSKKILLSAYQRSDEDQTH